MNYLEYASDEWVEVALTHHFNGVFLNKIPLLKKLQWREVVSVRGVAGRLSQLSKDQIIFPTSMIGLPKPYVEMSAGVENIFKIIRVDAMWRLTNLSKDNKSPARNFGLAISLNFSF